jgi:hypothetical protein
MFFSSTEEDDQSLGIIDLDKIPGNVHLYRFDNISKLIV